VKQKRISQLLKELPNLGLRRTLKDAPLTQNVGGWGAVLPVEGVRFYVDPETEAPPFIGMELTSRKLSTSFQAQERIVLVAKGLE
jgi:hypothetical protein